MICRFTYCSEYRFWPVSWSGSTSWSGSINASDIWMWYKRWFSGSDFWSIALYKSRFWSSTWKMR